MDRDELTTKAKSWSKQVARQTVRAGRQLRKRARESDLDQRLATTAGNVRDRIRALDGEQKLLVVVFSLLVVASVVVPPMLMGGPTGPTEASDVREGTVTSETQDGYSRVPADRVTTTSEAENKLPKPNVRASVGSQTMSITATEQDGDPVLTLADDRIHDGRWVSVNTKWFRETLGEVPRRAYITHESGDSYTSRVRVRDDTAAFYVREFSTNQVEFSGQVSLSGSQATDGTQYQYEVEDLDAASDIEGQLIGAEAVEWDNATGAGLADGDTLAVDPAGDEIRGPASGDPEVVFEGEAVTRAASDSDAGMAAGDSLTADVRGDLAPVNSEVTVTAHAMNRSDHNDAGGGNRLVGHNGVGDPIKSDVQVTNPPGTISHLKIDVMNVVGSGTEADIYIEKEAADQQYGEGTLVKSGWSTPTTEGTHVINISDYDTGGSTVTVSFVPATSGSDDGVTLAADGTGDGSWWESWGDAEHGAARMWALSRPGDTTVSGDAGASAAFGVMADGETATESFDASLSTSSLTVSADGGRFDLSFDRDEQWATTDPGLDLDRDGTVDVSHAGTLLPGETASYAAPSLDPSDGTATLTVGNATVAATVNLQEVSKSSDIAVDVNSQQVASAASLADGETTNFSASSSVLMSGTNTVNISVGDGSLSADAPEPQVGFEMQHDATSRQSAGYESEHWSERYNVSKTYASSRENATLSIPFQGNVVAVRSIEMRSNQTTWQSLTQSDYQFNNTTVTVDLGSVKANEQVEVRANGSKVQVANGSIQVLTPTTASDDLNTQVEITNRQSGFYIAYAATSGHIYHTENESWESPQSYYYADSSGHKRLYTPNAQSGSTFHVQSVPVTARPNAGDVHITDPVGGPEPTFNVSYGDHSGDTVKFTFQNASDGTDYVLYSVSKGLVRDSGTASSPLTLTDDDSVERLKFRIDTGSGGENGSGGGSGGDGGTNIPMPNAGDGNTPWIPLLGVALALAGVVITQRDPDAVTNAAGNVGTGFADLLEPIPYLGEPLGMVVEASLEAVGQLVATVVGNRVAAMSLAGALLIGAIQAQIIQLPQGSLVIVVVAGVAVFSGVALREYDEWSRERWVFIVTVTTFIALEVVSPASTSLYAAVLNSRMFPLVIGGGLYLAWKGVTAFKQPDEVTKVVIGNGNNDDDEKGGNQ